MDRLDLEHQPSQREAADTAVDRALWAQFAEAASAEAFCRSWLALQCRMIEGVSGALVLLGPPDRGPFSPIALTRFACLRKCALCEMARTWVRPPRTKPRLTRSHPSRVASAVTNPVAAA